MSGTAILMMILFMLVIWGGLVAALVNLLRAPETEAARALDGGSYVIEHE